MSRHRTVWPTAEGMVLRVSPGVPAKKAEYRRSRWEQGQAGRALDEMDLTPG